MVPAAPYRRYHLVMDAAARRSSWRRPLIAAGVIVLLAGGFWLRLELKCLAMKTQVEQLRQEIAAVDPRRPPLHPPGVPGNAWTDYQAALDHVLASQGPNVKWIRLPLDLQSNQVDRTAFAKALLGPGSPVVGLLRKGADRVEFRYPDAWSRGDTDLFDRYWEVLLALGLSIGVEARRLADEGDGKAAIELLMAGAQFSWDLGRTGPLASGIGGVVLTAIGDHLQERRVGAEDLEALGRMLGELDAGHQERAILRVRCGLLLNGVEFMEGKDPQAFLQDPQAPTWQDGWSPRVRRASSFLRSLDRIPRLEEAMRAPTAALEYAALTTLGKELRAGGSLLDAMGAVGWATHGHVGTYEDRSLHARLRMLRVAVRFLKDGSVLDLQDPYEGVPLLHERSGDRLKVWSAAAAPGVGLEKRTWKANDARLTILEVVR